ncbi:MAG: acyltransferase [Desulfobacteraceae bacterium]|nr:acyltransferase [Desulfobacteraceae bacterium]
MKAQEPGSVKEEIIPLTTLRGIAAILVVVFHVSFNFGTNFDVATWTKFFRKGYLWVDFFFILSGFIIMYTGILSVYSDGNRHP